MDYIFDTNAVINFICDTGDFSVLSKKDVYYISFITNIELFVGVKTEDEDRITKLFIKKTEMTLIDNDIIRRTINIRKNFGLKLPDAVIVATAYEKNATLVTSDKEIIKKAPDMNIKILDPLLQ